MLDGRKRVVVERITPQIDGGRFLIKRVVGESMDAEQDVRVKLLVGARLIEDAAEKAVGVDREELIRWADILKDEDCKALLPEIARMGFDVLYLPPIHPIGKTNRKGKNNTSVADTEDPGSPWAIGAEEGGHKSVHPLLGTMEDFETFVKDADDLGIEVSLDLAFQCSNDHPYLKEHPEWFLWRPDGTIQYAENPPKRYEDIVPFYFETDDWESLWEELKSIVLFWIRKGIRIFRVDNPHTKPFTFWEWLIEEIKRDYSDVIFLAEAFTRPVVMYRLAKLGFTRSYTYFTWRNTKQEFMAYLSELSQGENRECFRPNFWPNTPDILPEFLQYDGRASFLIRLVLAATLSSNYGIYGPPFELYVNEALSDKEEYQNSEKYEIGHWDMESRPDNLRDFIARINKIRREKQALQMTWNLTFHEVDNEYILFRVESRAFAGTHILFTQAITSGNGF